MMIDMVPLVTDTIAKSIPVSAIPNEDVDEESGNESPALNTPAAGGSPDFCAQALRFLFCFTGLQVSYLTVGYMQELIMTTAFEPTSTASDGRFPSAAFCAFLNRFLTIFVAIIAVRIRHGAVLTNNVAPLLAFAPCAVSGGISSWSSYAALRYVSFTVQSAFRSSKIVSVMIMGKVLNGTTYPYNQYLGALLITIGVTIFSVASKASNSESSTETIGLLFLAVGILTDCFGLQWQDKIYAKYGRANVDPYQMMLGVNSFAIIMTSFQLIASGDIPKVIEFTKANPSVWSYNIIASTASAIGQLFVFTMIKEFGPVVFTIIMMTRHMISVCISSIIFGHAMTIKALCGAIIVFGVLFYQIRRKYKARQQRSS